MAPFLREHTIPRHEETRESEGAGSDRTAAAQQLESDSHDLKLMEERRRVGIDKSHMMDLMRSLRKLARLRTLATAASVHARQKKREASIKRRNVWISDGKFMGEVQRLASQGKFDGLEELSRLASDCQEARDVLGPIEQESIDIEQEWEGHAWSLHQAEEEFDFDFQYEFTVANSYSACSSNSSTSHSHSSLVSAGNSTESGQAQNIIATGEATECHLDSAFADDVMPDLAELSILEFPPISSFQRLNRTAPEGDADLLHESDTVSGYADIDEMLLDLSPRHSNLDEESPKNRTIVMNEFYPQLLASFSTTRERINQWLEFSVLSSRVEAASLFSVLEQTFSAESQHLPSNWAQLVVAFWQHDEAATPTFPNHKDSLFKNHLTNILAESSSDCESNQIYPNTDNQDVLKTETVEMEASSIPTYTRTKYGDENSHYPATSSRQSSNTGPDSLSGSAMNTSRTRTSDNAPPLRHKTTANVRNIDQGYGK